MLQLCEPLFHHGWRSVFLKTCSSLHPCKEASGHPKGLTSIGFFTPGRGHVLGGFAFCDASFPSGFSFWKAPRGSVSEGASWSEARAQPASSPPETFSLERAEPATPVVHARHSSDDAREAGPWDACAVAGRNGLRVTMRPARCAGLAPQA